MPTASLRWGWGGFAAVAAVALLATAFAHEWIVLPDRWNPLAPLQPRDEPNVFTPWKLLRLDADPKACAVALSATRLDFTAVPDRADGHGCGWTDAVRITALPARVGTPFVLTCPAAMSLAMWEMHTVQPVALELWGHRVVAIAQAGSYACRDIIGSGTARTAARGGTGGGRRSEHATADALDIASFSLADGTLIDVGRDWQRSAGDRQAVFLRRVHEGACRWWHVVLGPEYNAAHRSHFHLDDGGFGACR